MFTIKNYALVETLEEAYLLNQKRSNVVLGGTTWLKMGERNIQTAIDLSGLGLNQIEESKEQFSIGCMVTLRELECHEGLNTFCQGIMRKALKHIVGVQFRNCATVGGSIYGRYGFSDVLSCFLGLDTYVELYKRGTISLEEFISLPYDNDILVRIIVKKDDRKITYLTHRRTATDFPVITCVVVKTSSQWEVVLGARPMKATIWKDRAGLLGESPTAEAIDEMIERINNEISFDSNMRASKEYRKHLAGVLIQRGIKELM